METKEQRLVRHEGLRLKPYRCTEGKLTIGIGRNLDDKGITEHEAYMLLAYDIDEVESWLLKDHPIYSQLDSIRQEVLMNMGFNLGRSGLSKFKKMWAALESYNYAQASAEMMDSRWALQVGIRAVELSGMMRAGVVTQ